jgi:3'(2'), 5'-bisphosphate nucleotidase
MSDQGAPPRPIRTRKADPNGLIVVSSRSHRDGPNLDAWFARHKVAERKNAGSSLKLCMVAAGEADVYPRFGPTCEWDICAGHAVLEAAGGHIVTATGEPLRYGKGGDLLNPDFIAWGSKCPASEIHA